jgi:hypothetical protein
VTRDGEEAPAVLRVPGFDRHEAGFGSIGWVWPRVSAEGVAVHGEEHWANYLEIPHALCVECAV